MSNKNKEVKTTKSNQTTKPKQPMTYEEKRMKALETYGSMRYWHWL